MATKEIQDLASNLFADLKELYGADDDPGFDPQAIELIEAALLAAEQVRASEPAYEAKIKAAVEALEPFTEADWDERADESNDICPSRPIGLVIGDVRRARATLKLLKDKS